MSDEQRITDERAKPFFLNGFGEKKGCLCLLIHGFTGSPAHLFELGVALSKAGYTVKAPLLKGHGTTAEDMEPTDWRDWLGSAEEAYLEECEKYEKVFLVGISMGGLISLALGGKYDRISGIITLNSPLKLRNKMAYFTPFLKYFKRFNEITPPAVQSGENADLDIGLPKTPVRCIPSLLKMIKVARKSLKNINTNILIVQSKIDGQVDPISAEIMFRGISSDKKRILWLEKSKHLCTLGVERKFIENEVINYINHFC